MVVAVESARELASRSSCVTADMMLAAGEVLRQFGIKSFGKKRDEKEIIYEMLAAAFSVSKSPEKPVDVLVKDEKEWTEFFKHCKVVVRNPIIGGQILRIGAENEGIYNAMISRIIQDSGLVVSLGDYPGITLFEEEVKVEDESTERTESRKGSTVKHLKGTVRIKET